MNEIWYYLANLIKGKLSNFSCQFFFWEITLYFLEKLTSSTWFNHKFTLINSENIKKVRKFNNVLGWDFIKIFIESFYNNLEISFSILSLHNNTGIDSLLSGNLSGNKSKIGCKISLRHFLSLIELWSNILYLFIQRKTSIEISDNTIWNSVIGLSLRSIWVWIGTNL